MPKKISPLNVYTSPTEITEDDWKFFAEAGGITIDDAARKSINRIADDLYADTCFDRSGTRSVDFKEAISSIHRNADALYKSLKKYDFLSGLDSITCEILVEKAEEANEINNDEHSMEFNFEVAKIFRNTPNKTKDQYLRHLVSQHIEAENSEGISRFETDHASIFFFSAKILSLMQCLEAITEKFEKSSDIGASSDENLAKFFWDLRDVFRQCGGDNKECSQKYVNFSKKIYKFTMNNAGKDTQIVDGDKIRNITSKSIRYRLSSHN